MNERILLFILIALFILVLVGYILLSRRQGLPRGKTIYDDLSADGVPTKPLTSKTYGLTGKPDLILRQGNMLIPVEIKSAPGRESPYPSHVMQLAVYCLLVEEHYGIRPEYGILRYRDRQFKIPYTEELQERLLDIAARVRNEDPKTNLPKKCSRPNKCAHCGFSEICDTLI